jgi:hypothetical protein
MVQCHPEAWIGNLKLSVAAGPDWDTSPALLTRLLLATVFRLCAGRTDRWMRTWFWFRGSAQYLVPQKSAHPWLSPDDEFERLDRRISLCEPFLIHYSKPACWVYQARGHGR